MRRWHGPRLIVPALAMLLALPSVAVAEGPPEPAPLAAPVLHEPQPGGLSGYSVTLSWDRVPDAVSYRVRARFEGYDADFIDTRTVNDQFLLHAVAGPGNLTWSVTAVAADGTQGAAASGTFAFAPRGITLLQPDDGAVVNFPNDGVEFRWTSDGIGESAAAHWDQNADSSVWTPPWSGQGSMTGKVMPWLPVGTSRWFVSTLGAADPVPRPAWSETRRVTVTWNGSTPQLDRGRSETTATAGDTVRLAWTPVRGASEYFVQFVEETAQFPVAPTTSDFVHGTWTDVVARAEGSYKWRVAAAMSGARSQRPVPLGPWSETGAVTVSDPCSGVRPESPADGAELDDYPILRWTATGCRVTVEIGLESTPFAGTTITTDLPATAIPGWIAQAVGDGDVTVRWRVRTDAPWRTFTVRRAQAPPLEAPEPAVLVSPAACDDPPTCVPVGGLPILRWLPVPGAAFYRVLIRYNAFGSPVTGTKDVMGTAAPPPVPSWAGLRPETEWAVIACATVQDCPAAMPALPWTYRTALPAPVAAGQSASVQVEPDVSAEWSFNLPDPTDDVLLVPVHPEVETAFTEADGTRRPYVEMTAGRSRARIADLGNGGTLRWRVRLIGYGVQAPWSDWREIRREEPAIVLLSPADGATVGSSPELRWEPLAHVVAGYEVDVTRAEDAEHPSWSTAVFGGQTYGASLTPSPALPPGHYTWTVSRMTPPGDRLGQGPVSTGHFVVAGDSQVTLVSPERGAVVPSNGAILRWSPVEAAGSYYVAVASDPTMADSSWLADGRTDMTEFAVPTELPAGPVYWMVCAALPEAGSGVSCSPVSSTAAGASAGAAPASQPLGARVAGTLPGTDAGGPTGVSEVRMMMVEGREVAPDTIPPTVAGPDLTLVSGGVISTTGGVPVDLRWSASDRGLGLASVKVLVTDGSGRTVAHPVGVAARSLRVRLSAGTYRLAVVASDLAGNTTTRTATRRLLIVDDRSGSWHWSASWRARASSVAYRGSTHASSTAGAWASLAANARSVALVVSRGPTRGSLVASTAGAPSRTIALRSAVARSRVVMPLWTWQATATRTLRFRLPQGGRAVVIDALVIVR